MVGLTRLRQGYASVFGGKPQFNEIMHKFGTKLIVGVFVLSAAVCAIAQETNLEARLSIDPAPVESQSQPKVTSVYGISADDYLPSIDALKKQARPNVRSAASRPSFDLPPAFYYIGGPIFILLFLRVLVIFLNGFEEKRREEQRQAELKIPEAE